MFILGILAIDDKYELTAHSLSSDKLFWTYNCKYRLTQGIRCQATAKVVNKLHYDEAYMYRK